MIAFMRLLKRFSPLPAYGELVSTWAISQLVHKNYATVLFNINMVLLD